MIVLLWGIPILLAHAVFWTYHYDALGLNLRHGEPIFRVVPVSPMLPDEQVIQKSSFISGSLDDSSFHFSSSMQAQLTDRRLVVRLVTSLPGVCLREISLKDITSVEQARKASFPRRYDVFTIAYIQNGQPGTLFLWLSHGGTWLRAFDAAGVQVRRVGAPRDDNLAAQDSE